MTIMSISQTHLSAYKSYLHKYNAFNADCDNYTLPSYYTDKTFENQHQMGKNFHKTQKLQETVSSIHTNYLDFNDRELYFKMNLVLY